MNAIISANQLFVPLIRQVRVGDSCAPTTTPCSQAQVTSRPFLQHTHTAAAMDHFMTDQSGPSTDPSSKAAAGVGSTGPSQSQQQQDDTGTLDQQQQHQEEEGEEASPPLTETIAVGLQNMDERRQQLHAMIDELAQVGLHFLDQQRQQFLRTLESYKEDVDVFCAEEINKSQRLSYDTLTAQDRLGRAQLLVQHLGGAVCQPQAGLLS